MTGMRRLRRDTRTTDAPDMSRMVAVTDKPPARSRGMLRARFPLAVAGLAAAVALIPATSASAAVPGLPSQVQEAIGSANGGSGSTPDLPGAVTDLTGCLQDASPEAPSSQDSTAPEEGAATKQTTRQQDVAP